MCSDSASIPYVFVRLRVCMPLTLAHSRNGSPPDAYTSRTSLGGRTAMRSFSYMIITPSPWVDLTQGYLAQVRKGPLSRNPVSCTRPECTELGRVNLADVGWFAAAKENLFLLLLLQPTVQEALTPGSAHLAKNFPNFRLSRRKALFGNSSMATFGA